MKYALCLILLLSSNQILTAQIEGCFSGDCQNGEGIYIYTDNNRYEGQFRQGLKHGKGKLVYQNGGEFVGEWFQDLKQGYGTDSLNGDVYKGFWENGKRNGKGTQLFFIGEYFEGIWLDDIKQRGTYKGKMTYTDGRFFEGILKPNGQPDSGFYSLTLPNGYKYEGSWYDGKMNGEGTLTINENTRYEGNFANNTMEGFGRLTEPNGVYEGNFVNNNKHGKGKYIYTTGQVYDGDWNEGVREGMGILTFLKKDGTLLGTYEGRFKNGKRETLSGEKAVLTYASGDVYQGEFKDDKQEGKGKYTFKSGNIYEGPFHGGIMMTNPYETGIKTYTNGAKYIGHFQDNKEVGEGYIVDKQNNKFSGIFADGKPADGPGKWTKPDGTVYEGYWKSGKFELKK